MIFLINSEKRSGFLNLFSVWIELICCFRQIVNHHLFFYGEDTITCSTLMYVVNGDGKQPPKRTSVKFWQNVMLVKLGLLLSSWDRKCLNNVCGSPMVLAETAFPGYCRGGFFYFETTLGRSNKGASKSCPGSTWYAWDCTCWDIKGWWSENPVESPRHYWKRGTELFLLAMISFFMIWSNYICQIVFYYINAILVVSSVVFFFENCFPLRLYPIGFH